ncbi:chemotaxis protein CheW [Stagnihabitans tardus]|uniref:Chemotaxis protein CheW n=1 Tax=Stagnihabitans tardus TaxID=2699202 RepID=A0AAE5BTH4_9RHOB|nr:chemotaxis protein CheW [Stagnihabitans tardus]NBZ86721.1 chemotaxis protein CheW [Stagnihabitans tardus]
MEALPPMDETETGPEMSLILRLNGESLAIPVRHVHEVINAIPRTRVPNASAMAPWLINVRGAVVPLVDVRRRLKMPPRDHDDGRIVVLDIPRGAESHRLALLADGVEEVMEIDPLRIEPLPPRGAPWPIEFVRGSIRRDGDLVLILEPESLFEPETGSRPLH